MGSQGSAVYRLFRRSRAGLALSVLLNLALLGAGFAIAILGDMANGVIENALTLTVFFGFAVGLTFTAVANVIIELSGPSEQA